ncbi:MAG: RNA 2',3'-cyclic phosphodiesterase [Ahrensia sp.]|nr:RNA 2',3'-cyclic phosphodiesterase [Ahrensia sp.]
MPRLFTGLEVPAILRTRLSFLQSGLDGVRWVEPGDFHITLRFIGDVSPRMADDICEALSGRDWTAPNIAPGELKAFGGSKPSSICVSISDDKKLQRLAASQERLMQCLGLPADSRKFKPHITLARCRGSAKSEQVARYLAQNGGFSAPVFEPSRFVLYSARESSGGGPYHVEECWDFTG